MKKTYIFIFTAILLLSSALSCSKRTEFIVYNYSDYETLSADQHFIHLIPENNFWQVNDARLYNLYYQYLIPSADSMIVLKEETEQMETNWYSISYTQDGVIDIWVAPNSYPYLRRIGFCIDTPDLMMFNIITITQQMGPIQ